MKTTEKHSLPVAAAEGLPALGVQSLTWIDLTAIAFASPCDKENFVFKYREKISRFKYNPALKWPLFGRSGLGGLSVSAASVLKGIPAETATSVPARKNLRRESDIPDLLVTRDSRDFRESGNSSALEFKC